MTHCYRGKYFGSLCLLIALLALAGCGDKGPVA